MHSKDQVMKVLGVLREKPDEQTRVSDAMDVDSIAPQTDNDTKGVDSEKDEQPSISFEYSAPLKGPTVSPPRSPPKHLSGSQDLKRSPQMSHSRQTSPRSSQQASQTITAVVPPTTYSQRSLASSKGIEKRLLCPQTSQSRKSLISCCKFGQECKF
jgi:hypothetical protein